MADSDRTAVCFVAGCSNPTYQYGPRFARMMCEECRAGIPAAVQVALTAQDAIIDTLAQRSHILLETLYQMAPKRLLKQRSRAEGERIFLDLNFGDQILHDAGVAIPDLTDPN